ncbi:MAG: hypothetical protein IJW51_05995 [Clostridia bacterium]|nr:hypothetical protein [Clostridia bacterium]
MKNKRLRARHPIMEQIKTDKKAYTVYAILSMLILTVIVRSAFLGRWENVFTGVLASLLLLIPPVVERSFHINLPTTLEIFAYLFVFCAEILGEIGNFYMHFPFWDTMLHTFNGFMFAAFGFCLVDIFNKTKRFRFQLSPVFLALVAFCFSMTIGVLWEFFEFGADMLLHTDMQKDTLTAVINSVSLPNDLGEKVTHVTDIVSTTVVTAGGEVIVMNGYLDIGLADTVKDLFVNFIGAVLFSVLGYFYVKHRGRGRVAEQFIPVFVGEDGEELAQGATATKMEGEENKNI